MTEEETKKPSPPPIGFLLTLVLIIGFLGGFAWSMGDALAYSILETFEEPVDYSLVCSQLEKLNERTP